MTKPVFVERVIALENGVSMDVSERIVRSNKVPLLLFNGIGTNSGPTRAVAGQMDRTTICFDVPKRSLFGQFGKLPNTEPEYIASRVDEMLVELGYSEVDVLGVSWGGMLAQVFARQRPTKHRPRPTKVRRLVLVATMSGWTSKKASPGIFRDMLRLRFAKSKAARLHLGQIVYGGDLIDQPKFIELLPGENPPSGQDWAYRLLAFQLWSSQDWLGELTMPTLVMSGEGDPLVPAKNARDLARNIPNSHEIVIKKGGHLFLLTRKGMVGIIEKFLN